MATKVQRVQTIADAIFNTAVPAAKLERLGRALAAQNIDIPAYDTLTAGEKAAIVIDGLQAFLVKTVQDYEAGQAARTALVTQQQVVATDFTQVP